MLRQIIQPKTETKSPGRKDKIPALRETLLKCLVFLALSAMIGWGSLDDGFRFLFQIDKSAISEYDATISRSELWSMKQGTWCLLAIAAATIVAAITAVKMFRLSRESPDEDPPDYEPKT